MEAVDEQTMLDRNWSSQRQEAKAHFGLMSRGMSSEACDAAATKLCEFTSQPPPASYDAAQIRYLQRCSLASILSLISHTEMMLRQFPDRNEDRMRLVISACSMPLPNDRKEMAELASIRMAISMQVSSISSDQIANRRRS